MSFEIITPASREAWLEERKRFVTATEVASAYTTRTVANWERIRDTKTGVAHFQGNVYTRWGHEREPVLAQYAELFVNAALVLNTDPQQMVVRDGVSASPDAFTLDYEEGAEFKTTTVPIADNPAYEKYLCQIQVALWITGAKRWHLIAEQHTDFVPGDITHEVIEPDTKLQAELVAVADELAQFVFDGVRPDWMGGADSLDDALALEQLVTQLAAVQEQTAVLRQEETALKQQIGDLVGGSASDEVAGWKLTVSTTAPSLGFDSKAFKQDHAELWEQYRTRKVAGARRVGIKRIKENA